MPAFIFCKSTRAFPADTVPVNGIMIRNDVVHRRILNVYFVREEGILSLRFVEMQRIDEAQEVRDRELPEHWRRLQDLNRPRFARICPDIHE